jgi:Flp pilus assembly protein TadD
MATLTRPFSAVGASFKRGAAAIAPKETVITAKDPLSLDNVKEPDASLYLAMAHFSERAGGVEQAVDQYQRALAIEPNNLEALMGLAHLRDRRGQFAEATTIYQQITQKFPQNAAAWNDLGVCLARRGMLNESLGAMQTAIQLDPEKDLYRNNVAEVLVEMGRNQEALTHLVAAHGQAVGAYNLGYMLQDGGQSAAAVQYFSQALAADPALSEARHWLSRLTTPPAAPANQNMPQLQNPAPAIVDGRQPPLQSADIRGGGPGAAPPKLEYQRYNEYTVESATPPTIQDSLAAPRAPGPDEVLRMPVPLGQPNPGGPAAIAPSPGPVNEYHPIGASPYPPVQPPRYGG